MIEIVYKCRCMNQEARTLVRERRSDEDVLDWMHAVQAVIGADHAARSPVCMATKMEYAKIPVEEGAQGLGHKARRQ